MEDLILQWKSIKEQIKKDLNILDVSYNMWILPLEIKSIENDELTISAPTNIRSEGITLIENRYASTLQVLIEEFTGRKFSLKFVLDDQIRIEDNTQATDDNNHSQNAVDYREIIRSANLNLKYTFDNFVEGPNNSFARSAADAVVESPGYAYNPIFIWGGPGLGKTHLMHAIGHEIIKRNPSTKVLYVTSETFTNEIVESVRYAKQGGEQAKLMAKFREKYRNVDVLMVDDVQFMIGKEGTQEEFFNTFNVLHSSNKQIVISSDRPPKDLKTLEERLISRFNMGIIADIGAPNYETRMAILRKNAENNNIIVDDEIIQYIATKIHTNIRDLEGSFNNMIRLSNWKKEDHITMDTAKEAIKDRVDPDEGKVIDVKLIINKVTSFYNIKEEDILSKKRSNDIAYPRQIVMYLCKTMTNLNISDIGKALGDRDHSTVIYGAKKIEDDIKQKKEVKEKIDQIIKLIENS